ncbi:uncharacterized protein MELLADRAFT_109292 [Melampsora larici-populina 98AG31]|uniref:CREG-like beta-barrel domain-containing protein n=1 Tax=Melampsora larici-populina (strain 98AG31 / pathotype 3-4-7) TaxID=747676 RepID=F4RW02_MELLP|nr:uncharacterized protein MELLADRAFT_109292 [Melampsora larici-populina 98AG31]EGG03494.1 hypothetical protein MELLADRAFT_109292 [Melampsora larici-populina 98AG31]
MLFHSSTILFSTSLILQSVVSLTLPSEFIKQSTPTQLHFKEPSSSLSSNLHDDDEENNQENLKQAAIHARELIQYRSKGVGTLISTFPKDHPDESLQGLPIGLQEYFAPYPNGDLLLLSLPISNIYHNIETDVPNHSATLSIKDELASIQRQSSLWSANWRRISLFGKLEPIEDLKEAKELYERFHPDSTLWDGNDDDAPHVSKWVRFKVEKVFYFGGFGDRGAIGWLDMEHFKNDFKNTPQAETRSRCFHPEGQNLYCDQPNLGPEITQIEEVETDQDLEDDQEEYEIELWEELDEPVITQIINNNYITHHHHHHYRSAAPSSIASRPSGSNEILEAIEEAVTEMREELMEMTDEMMEMTDEMMEIADEMIEENEDESEEEESDEIFSKEDEDEVEESQDQEETEEIENEMLDKAFKSMGLIEILDDFVDLTEVDEHHDQQPTKEDQEIEDGVKFEVEI